MNLLRWVAGKAEWEAEYRSGVFIILHSVAAVLLEAVWVDGWKKEEEKKGAHVQTFII